MAIDNEKHLCDGKLDKNSVTEKISATAADRKNTLIDVVYREVEK